MKIRRKKKKMNELLSMDGEVVGAHSIRRRIDTENKQLAQFKKRTSGRNSNEGYDDGTVYLGFQKIF